MILAIYWMFTVLYGIHHLRHLYNTRGVISYHDLTLCVLLAPLTGIQIITLSIVGLFINPQLPFKKK